MAYRPIGYTIHTSRPNHGALYVLGVNGPTNSIGELSEQRQLDRLTVDVVEAAVSVDAARRDAHVLRRAPAHQSVMTYDALTTRRRVARRQDASP